MSVPTWLQTGTFASDASASTTHQITSASAIRSQGGAIGPSAIVFGIVYDNGTGGIGTSVTGTSGATYTRRVNEPNAANGFTLEVWEATNVPGGAIETLTWTGSSAVKAKLAFAELDQVAPVSPYDGTSSPFDQKVSRIDTTDSIGRSAASTNTTKNRSVQNVFIGFIGWNDNRTISNAGSSWDATSEFSLSGGSTSLGIGVEKKATEVSNIAGNNCIARFTMSSHTAPQTRPAAVAGLTFMRDGRLMVSEDGTIDNIEMVSTVYTTNTSNFVVRTSASAPGGGTGGSEMSKYYGFFPRYYPPSGTTIGSTPDFNFQLLGGDDTDPNFGFVLSSYKNNQLGSTLDLTDENVAAGHDYFGISLNATVAGLKTLTLDYSQDVNPTGTTVLMLHSEGDGFGFGTWNYLDVGDYTGNTPAFLTFYPDYPVLAHPRTFTSIFG